MIKEHMKSESTFTLPEYCKVAPRMESKMLPKKPPNAATTMMGHCGAANCSTAVSMVFNITI